MGKNKRVWPMNNAVDGLEFVYEKEDEKFVEEIRERRPGLGMYDCKFKVRGVDLNYLPRRLGFNFYQTTFATKNIRCETECTYKYLNECWCSCMEDMNSKTKSTKIFEATASNPGNNTIYKIKVNMIALNIPGMVDLEVYLVPLQTADDISPIGLPIYSSNATNSSIITYPPITSNYPPITSNTCTPVYNNTYNNRYNYNNTYNNYAYNNTSKITFDIVTIKEGKLQTEEVKMEYEMTLFRCKFKYDCKVLPNEIKALCNNISYYSDKLLCQSKLFGQDECPCPICWCPLINQLRTNKKGKIRIPLRLNNLRYDYWVQVQAEIDATDPDLIHLDISFDQSCYIPVDDAHEKKLNYFIQFEIRNS